MTFDIASGIIISLGTDITGQFSLTDADFDRITASQVFVDGSNTSLAYINNPINLVSDMGLAVQARTISVTGQAALSAGHGRYYTCGKQEHRDGAGSEHQYRGWRPHPEG